MFRGTAQRDQWMEKEIRRLESREDRSGNSPAGQGPLPRKSDSQATKDY